MLARSHVVIDKEVTADDKPSLADYLMWEQRPVGAGKEGVVFLEMSSGKAEPDTETKIFLVSIEDGIGGMSLYYEHELTIVT